MNFRTIGLSLVAVVAIGTAAAGVAQTPPGPPPPPLPNTNRTAAPALTPGPARSAAPNPGASGAAPAPLASPSAASTGAPTRGAKPAASSAPAPAPSTSGTPEAPQFSSLDGIWEVELQPYNTRRAVYSHFGLIQDGTKLSGYWEHSPGRTHSPVTGSFDGRLISLETTEGTAKLSFSGYVENLSDMVGVQKRDGAADATAFTAQHRKKEKI